MTERPLLVLLHGWGSSATVWQPVIRRLQADFECYAPSLPGHGESDLIETQLEPLARQLLAIAGRPAIWLGWSLGALIAMQSALLAPQQVKQLLLVAGTPAFIQNPDWDVAMQADTFDQFQRDFTQNKARTLKRFMALQSYGDQQAKTVQRQLSRSSAPVVDAIGWGLDTLRQSDLLKQLPALHCQMHCLYGENDALVPATIAHPMREYAEVSLWPETGHAPFLSQPDAFAEWLNLAIKHG